MADTHIRNPFEWGVDRVRRGKSTTQSATRNLRHWTEEDTMTVRPQICRIGVADLKSVLAEGFGDFGANRTDVVFLCIMYPIIGLVLGRLMAGYDMLPLLFPLASGFALVGPAAAIGLYEMSRRREQGIEISWADAFGVVRSPSFGAILLLGLILMMTLVLWLMTAGAIYELTLGPGPPASAGAFVHDMFTTPSGWAMIVVGVSVGFLFALFVLAISVVSFPMLLDREIGVPTAMWTSARAVAKNPVPMAVWGLIVAAGVLLGSIPFFVGLVVVLPVLGHATWHLYRRVVSCDPPWPEELANGFMANPENRSQ